MKNKSQPKQWQLVAFIFARPICTVVAAMVILGVLYTINELFKSVLTPLVS